MMIDMLARKLLELDQEELEQVLEAAKEKRRSKRISSWWFRCRPCP